MAGAELELRIRIAENELRAQAASAGAALKNALSVPVDIDTGKTNADIQNLAAQLLDARAGLSSGTEATQLEKQAALLRESLRYKQQLSDIRNAGLSDEDLQNAERLAQELNQANVQSIEFGRGLRQTAAEAALAAQGYELVVDKLRDAANALRGFVSDALTAATDLENAQAAIRTLTDDQGANDLINNLRGVADELNNQASLTELAAGSYDVLSAGFTDSADAAEIMRNALLAAKGGFSDVGTVSDALTTVLNSYGLSAADAANVTDQLVQVQNLGKITVDQYANQIGALASTAASAGVPLEELNAAIATATFAGVKPEQTFSGLRAAISAILKPTQEASDLANELGITFDAATLQSQGLSGILEQLRDSGGASAENLSVLFGSVEAVTAIAPILNDGLETFDSNLLGISDSAGTAQAAFDEVTNTFEGASNALKNQFTDALASLGGGIQTALTPVIQFLTVLVENFNALPEPIKGFVGVALAGVTAVTSVAVALAGVAAVLPVLSAGYTALTSQVVANTTASVANAAAQGGISAGFKGIMLSAKGAAGAIGANLPLLAAIGGAAASIGLVAETFRSINREAAKVDAGTRQIEEALANIDRVNASLATSNQQREQATGSAIERNIQLIEDERNVVDKLLDGAREAYSQAYGVNLNSDTESVVQRNEISIDRQRQSIDDLLSQIDKLSAQDIAALDPTQVEALTSALDASQSNLESWRITSDAAATSQIVYGNSIQSARERLTGQTDALAESTAALQDNANAMNSAAAAGDLFGSSFADAQAAVEQQQQDANEARLRGIELANRQAESAFQQAQTAEIQSVRQAQADRVLSAQEAEDQIAAIRQRGLDTELGLLQQQLAQVDQLRADGTLTEEEALSQQLDLQDQIATLNLQRVEEQIAAQERLRQAEIDRLNEVVATEQARAEQETGLLDLQNQALGNQLNLLAARNGLQQAQFDLQAQRLQNALQEAEAVGNVTEAEQIRAQIAEQQSAQLEAQQAFQQEQLSLQQEQNALELERQNILAEVATLEAEIAIQQAQTRGASDQEIANLQRILELRQAQQDSLAAQAAQQDELNQLAQEQLNTEQQTAREQLAQQQAQADQQAQDQASGSSSGGGSSSGSGGSSSGLERSSGGAQITATGTAEVGALMEARNILSQVGNSFGDLLSRIGNTNNQFVEQLLAARGNSTALELATLKRAGEGAQATQLAAELDRAQRERDTQAIEALTAEIRALANQPKIQQLSLQSADLAGELPGILNSIRSGSLRGAGL